MKKFIIFFLVIFFFIVFFVGFNEFIKNVSFVIVIVFVFCIVDEVVED